jgi:tRNA A-37 threonylcarbamoyl transferase component Bud32/tetratricopeptide (TPR) repeat protein
MRDPEPDVPKAEDPPRVASALAVGLASAAPAGPDYPRLQPISHDHYVVGAQIAEGGMGRVLRARDRRLGRDVALKEATSPELAARLEREARLAAHLHHPSIVTVHEAGVWPTGEPFFAMELVSGRALDQVIAEARTMAQRLALLPHVLATADALAYAHAHGVIHRDLKPGNVMVGEFGETVVIDWGLAKELAAPDDDAATDGARRPAETQHGALIGTPEYMAPEQARGEPVDQRADVFAIGALLFHLLAGRPPFEGSTRDDVLDRAADGKLARLPAEAPPDLVAIVHKAMARAPAARYPSARELAEDLRRFQTGQLVGAHRYTLRQRAGRFLRRHKAAVAVAAVLLVALAAMALYGVDRIVRERDIAVDERNIAREQRLASERLVSFVLGDVHDELVKVGRVKLLKGIADEVERYFSETGARGLDETARTRRAQAMELLGDVAWAQADRDGAAVLHGKAIALREQLVREAPQRRELQLALGRGHAKLGQDLEDHDRPAAAAEYAIADKLLRPLATGRGPDPEARTELGTMLVRVGDGQRARGDLEAALATYRESIALREALQAVGSPSEQLSFSQALDRTAMALLLKHELPEAQALLERSRAMREALVKADPTNTEWLAALQLTLNRLAQVLTAKPDLAAAEPVQRASVELARQLTTRDPDNTVWRDSLYVALSTLGVIYYDRRALDPAEAAFAESRKILGQLVAQDPSHKRRRRNLAIAENKLGLVRERRGDLAGALAHYRAGIEVETRLVAEDASDIDSFDMLTADQQNAGNVLLQQGDVDGALVLLRARVAGQDKLVAKDPERAEWRQGLAEGLASLWQALRKKPALAAEAAAVHRRAVELVDALANAGKLDADGEKIRATLAR